MWRIVRALLANVTASSLRFAAAIAACAAGVGADNVTITQTESKKSAKESSPGIYDL